MARRLRKVTGADCAAILKSARDAERREGLAQRREGRTQRLKTCRASYLGPKAEGPRRELVEQTRLSDAGFAP